MTLPLSSATIRVTCALIEDRQVLGLLRLRNRGDSGRVLGADVAAAAIAIAVIGASRPPSIGLRIDRRRRVKRIPAQRLRGLRHVIQKIGGAQRRHGIFALARAFINIARRIELALNVARLAGDADLVLHDVVVRLQFVVADAASLRASSPWEA